MFCFDLVFAVIPCLVWCPFFLSASQNEEKIVNNKPKVGVLKIVYFVHKI